MSGLTHASIESSAMTQLPTEQGYSVPITTQFSVFLDNRVGTLYEMLEALDSDALTIAGLSVLEAADHGVIRVVTSRARTARQRLRAHNLPFSESSVVVVEATPERSLYQMCKLLREAELSVHFAYPLMVQPHGAPALVLQTDDTLLAGQVLLRKGFSLLGEAELEMPGDHGFDLDDFGPGSGPLR